MTSNDIVARCIECRGEFTEKDIHSITQCPLCGNPNPPLSPTQDVSVDINWLELRILCTWAEQWAHHIDTNYPQNKSWPLLHTVHSIVKDLQIQYPTYPVLTLSAEVSELKEKYPDIKVIGGIPISGPKKEDIN
jgi:hypothetical protein